MSAATASRARIARRKAASLGLRLRQRGTIYQLRDGDVLAVSGPLAAIENYLTAYCLHLAAAGHTAPTIKLRRATLGQMARGLDRPPTEVTGAHLVAWFARQKWKAATRRNYRSSARGFLAWAYQHGHVTVYLGDHLPAVRNSDPAPRPVPDAVWRDALAAADPRQTVMLRLAAEAGLRRAEVARVHVRDLVDGVGGAQLVVHGKGNKVRLVPISAALADLIRAGAAGHTPELAAFGAGGWLFPGQIDGHLSPGQVGDLVGRLLPPGYSMHKLRHRYATRAYRGTRNLRAVQTLLGHASVATTQRYTAVDDDEIRAAAMAATL